MKESTSEMARARNKIEKEETKDLESFLSNFLNYE